jgi:hypothetical protein
MGLLSFLGLGGKKPREPQKPWGYDPDGYLVQQEPALGGAPQGAMGGPEEEPDDIVVTGDPWKPKNQSLLSILGDMIAYQADGSTPFAEQNERRNMMEASKTLMSDPDQAIRRISKFNPELAWKYREKTVDDKRMQHNLDRQNELLDFQKRKHVFSQVGNMMNVAAKRGDVQTWTEMRNRALTYAQTHGIDASTIIPEQFDPEALEYIALGEVPVAKQMQLEETKDWHGKTDAYRHANLEERRDYHSGQLSLGRERNGISAGRAQVAKEQGERRLDQADERITNDRSTSKAVRLVKTPHGDALMNADGTQLKFPSGVTFIKGPDGKFQRWGNSGASLKNGKVPK